MQDEPSLEQPRSLLAPYDQALFVSHRGWTGLSQVLETRGAGSYGLSGPRGSGKTWVMERALELTEEKKGLGVWFPSPSEYEPIAFLSALSDHVAISFEELHDRATERPTKASRIRYFRRAVLGLLLAYFAVAGLLLENFPESGGEVFDGFLTFGNAVWLAIAVVGATLFLRAVWGRRADREGLGLVRTKAEELRSQVRFSTTATESDEVNLSAGYRGLGGLLKRARERQLVERPATLSSLIHNFRAFARLTADELEGPVVIAIDELDKMSDAERVAQLLRDIKGIFEIPGVCFLVSLSDEAAQALELGAVRARNEFNSSFYTVISMPPLSPTMSLELLRMRDSHFDSKCGRALGILTGGVSRELVRVAELVRIQCGIAPTLQAAVAVALGEELDAFRAWILQTASARGRLSALGDEGRISLFDAVEQAKGALVDEDRATFTLVEESWHLNAGNPVWEEQFAEEWRRLLVRLGVADRMLDNSDLVVDDADAEHLQRVVQITSASAAVGRRYLELELDPA